MRRHLKVSVVLVSAIAGTNGLAEPPADSPDGDQVVRVYTAPIDIGDGDSIDGARGIPDFFPLGAAPEADSHAACAFLPNGSAVVVANRESKNLVLFNPLTRAFVRAIQLTGTPESIAISPDGTRAITANLTENTASLVDMANGVELLSIPVGTYPSTARITPDGTKAIISNSGSQNVSVIRMSDGAVLRTIATGGLYQQLSANGETAAYAFKVWGPALADNSTLVFPDNVGDRILIVDIDSGVVTALPSAADPFTVTVTPDGSKALVTHFNTARKLTVVDVPGRAIVKSINIGSDLQGPLAVNAAGTKAFVAVLNNCRSVDLVTDAVSADISTASVNDMLVTADGQYALCVGFRGSLLSFATGGLVRDLNNFVSTSIGTVSPTAALGMQFSDTFGEDMVVMTTNGAAGNLQSAGPSGPAPEADRSRTVALTPDGSKAVVVSQQSQTAAIVDTATGEVSNYVTVDRRPGIVRITPNGAKAVVSSRDGTNLSIINVGAGTKIDVPISTRADEIEISPDGQFAYVAVVVTDGVWRVNLNTNTVQGARLTTGNMGSVGYGFQPNSGMKLSHNGATLVTCNSFDNTISIIDTASWAVVRTLTMPVSGTTPGFPTYAVFSPDDSKIYVSCRDIDRVAIVNNAGAGSTLGASIVVGDFPYLLAASPDGQKLFVVNYSSNNVGVVNLNTNVQVATIPGTAQRSIEGMQLSADGSRLYVSDSNGPITFGAGGYTRSQFGELKVIDAATNAVLDTIQTARLGAALALSADGTTAAIANPWGDGVTVFDFAGCPADFDGDGFVTGVDFDLFVGAFEAGDQEADFDGDGFVTGVDFDLYVGAYEAGC